MSCNFRALIVPVFQLAAASLALAVSAGSLTAAPLAFVDPATESGGWSRGVAGSTYQAWDVFAGDPASQSPAPGAMSPGSPLLGETTGAGFITGGGNIYSGSAATSFVITVPNHGYGAGSTTSVLLQTKTLGTELDPASVRVDGVAYAESRELRRAALGGFGGADVETLWRWNLPGNAASYTVTFGALESSMSLDALIIDTFATPVPEPGAAALCLAAIACTTLTRAARRGASTVRDARRSST